VSPQAAQQKSEQKQIQLAAERLSKILASENAEHAYKEFDDFISILGLHCSQLELLSFH